MWNPFRREKKNTDPAPANTSAAIILGLDEDVLNASTGFADYNTQLLRGFAENPYVNKAVDVRAHAVAILDPVLYNSKGEIIEDKNHPLVQLLRNPNPRQSWAELCYDIQSHYALNGNAFIWLKKEGGNIKELWAIPPSAISYISSNDIFDPVRLWYINAGSKQIQVAPQEMVHLHSILGVDGIMGVSPLQSAALSIRAQTSARQWNTALLDNSSCPSLALSTDEELTDEQFSRLSASLERQYTGTRNAGKTMVLDKGLHAEGLGAFNAKDMDYTQGIVLTAREIAIALDVPPELIGDSTNKTYNSMSESIRQFANTVCSLADRMYNALSRAIAGNYADVESITYDRQQVDGLSDKPGMADITAADWLTVNEKRDLLSYPPVDGGNVILTAMGQVPLKEVASDIEDLVPDDED